MYKRRFYPRRTSTFKRRYPYKKRYPMYRKKATASFAARVRRVVAAEKKQSAVSIASTELAENIDYMIPFTANIPVGTGAQSQRIGNWIKPVRITATCILTGFTGALTTSVYNIRVGVLCYKNDHSADPILSTEILQDVGVPQGPYDYQRKGDFQILSDRFFSLVNDDDSAHFTKSVKFDLSLAKLPQALYDGVNPKKNHIFLFCTTDAVPGVPNELPTITMAGQLLYTDS